MCNTVCNVYEVGRRVGYRYVRVFIENFWGKYGISPNEYRKEQKGR